MTSPREPLPRFDIPRTNPIDRRRFLQVSAGGIAGIVASGIAPEFVMADKQRPGIPFGVQSGDPTPEGIMIWSASDRPAQMWIETATRGDFSDARRHRGPDTLADTAFTGKVHVPLPGGRQHYRVWFESLADGTKSATAVGRLRVPSLTEKRSVRLLWSGDTAGQGWGISAENGGMRTYSAMQQHDADAFLHCGDQIYADNPLKEEVTLPDGTTWHNLVTPAKSKVAETLDEFRGNFSYNLLDENVRTFNAATPMIGLWDDHEVVNNWYPGEILDDDRYQVKSVDVLASRARRALAEWTPSQRNSANDLQVFRQHRFGPLVDVFALDMRSYRGPNGKNLEKTQDDRTRFLGREQLEWLSQAVAQSQATWKVIASDMPLGLLVRDSKNAENCANRNGPPRGRELEIAELLTAFKTAKARNIVWLTADVHYTAAHHYHPDQAPFFKEFDPFWEFVSGPLNAGSFGKKGLDNTFGPKVVFHKAPPRGKQNLSPKEGLQFFGEVIADAETRSLTVNLRDAKNDILHTQVLAAQ